MPPYGSSSSPVPHDPLSEIVEFHYAGRADIIVIRSGRDLPNGVAESGRNVVFAPDAPAQDLEKDSVLQMDALLEQYYVGAFTDATNVDPDPPTSAFYRDTPFRAGGENNLLFGTGVLETPSSTQWGERSLNYNGQGMYYWHVGRVGANTHQGGIQCCLINARKMLWDFRRLGNKSLPKGSDGYRDVRPANMSTKVYYQGTFPAGGSDNLMCEFAAYKITDPEVSGDFFLVDNGAAYANSVRKIARKVVRILPSVLLPEVSWSYNFKKEIEVSANIGIEELTEAEMGPFEQQPGG